MISKGDKTIQVTGKSRSPKTPSVTGKSPPDFKSTTTASESYSSPALTAIKNVLSNPKAQKVLLQLYRLSQSEHKRNGKCSPDVGVSREKDLVAVLAYFMKGVDYKLDNNLPEDVLVLGEKISIKNFSDSASFKVKWTSDGFKAREAISSLCNPDYDHPHLIAINIIKKQQLKVHLIANTTIKSVISQMGENAFSSATGKNNRGVELSKPALTLLKKGTAHVVTILGANLDSDIEDPIEKRRCLIDKFMAE